MRLPVGAATADRKGARAVPVVFMQTITGISAYLSGRFRT
jgi:hypothetical protein